MKHKGTLVCVSTSSHVNPAQDFNDWVKHTFNEINIKYKSKISCTRLDSTSDEVRTS
jgi:NAD-dependent SIR2 family protein deacetylase